MNNKILKSVFHDPLPHHQTIAVFGLGASGLAAAHLLAEFHKNIIASDTAPEDKRKELESKLPLGTKLILGKNDYQDATAIVISPGMQPDNPVLCEAGERKIPILAELELAARSTTTPMIAITGTDGKTTTTTLTNHILNYCGKHAHVAGNIGIPLSHVVQNTPNLDYLVVETSAFQLPFCQTFHPKILISTNIAEDHSEYFHGDWQRYIATKRKPLSPMILEDTAVLNASDPEILNWRNKTQARPFWYASAQVDIPKDAVNFAYYSEKELIFCYQGERFAYPIESLTLKGVHNYMNVLAAVCACMSVGCSFVDCFKAIETYKLPPHRIETICTRNGVTFIDDSKATNPHAAIAGLTSLHQPAVLIAGGVDKGLHLGLWIETMRTRITALVLMGELTQRLQAEAKAARLKCPIITCETLPEAVQKAYELACNTKAKFVLLSPACSSYDMFDNYNQRGEVFAHAALEIP